MKILGTKWETSFGKKLYVTLKIYRWYCPPTENNMFYFSVGERQTTVDKIMHGVCTVCNFIPAIGRTYRQPCSSAR